jgi:hypothetical protein
LVVIDFVGNGKLIKNIEKAFCVEFTTVSEDVGD